MMSHIFVGGTNNFPLIDEFLQTMEKSQNNVMADVNHLIAKQDDPRRAEVFRAIQT